jgi:hypothetical protein
MNSNCKLQIYLEMRKWGGMERPMIGIPERPESSPKKDGIWQRMNFEE